MSCFEDRPLPLRFAFRYSYSPTGPVDGASMRAHLCGFLARAVLVLLFIVAFGASGADAQTCPGATPNDSTDDSAAIQACLNAGGTVRLNAGYYWIGTRLDLTHDHTILTNNGGGRPSLLAKPGLDGPLLETHSADYWEIRNVQFGGMLYTRTLAWKCGAVPHRKFGNNLFVGGNGWKIDNIDSSGALCGSGLEVAGGSNWEITDSTVGGNGRSIDENNGVADRWADGITLLSCENGYVGNNTLIDNTDVQLIVGGGEDCIIENNYIRSYQKHAFAGFMSGMFGAGGGDHPNSFYRYNDIGSSYNRMAFGIIAGFHPWSPTVPVYWAGEIEDNVIAGAVVNLAIDGIANGVIQGNTMSGAQGNKGFNCTIAANYTAGHFGSATKQAGWVSRTYHYPSC